MASSNWTELTGGLSSSVVSRGVTSGVERPAGGGNYVYGFNSKSVAEGAVGFFANHVNFAPMAKGGSIRGAMKRAPSGGPTGFAPMLFIGLQGAAVTDQGYLLGLSDEDPHHIVLRKGSIVTGIADSPVDPDTSPNLLMRSTASYENDTWLHLRLDMLVQGSGDVILQAYQNDLETNDVDDPSWVVIPGMEGDQYPTITGFVDDALGINSGSAPFASGRAGFAFHVEDVTRRAYFDHLVVARQL